MANITIGESTGHARLDLTITLGQLSQMNIDVGAGHDMSVRQINIIEREKADIDRTLEQLQRDLAQLRRTAPTSEKAEVLARESTALSNAAINAIKERKWYQISTAGFVEAAKAIGDASTPIATSVLALLKLLKVATSA